MIWDQANPTMRYSSFGINHGTDVKYFGTTVPIPLNAGQAQLELQCQVI
jgi:hypothetical protein